MEVIQLLIIYAWHTCKTIKYVLLKSLNRIQGKNLPQVKIHRALIKSFPTKTRLQLYPPWFNTFRRCTIPLHIIPKNNFAAV